MLETITDDEIKRRTEKARQCFRGRDQVFEGADLSHCDLNRRNLRDYFLVGANCRNSDLTRARLSRANLEQIDMRGACLEKTNCYESNLDRARFDDADLQGVEMKRVSLEQASFCGADLNQARICEANMALANLQNVDMHDPYFFRNRLWYADMRGANIPDYIANKLYEENIKVPVFGEFTGWKPLAGYLIHVLIPERAHRVGGLAGLECRASFVHVISITRPDGHQINEAIENGDADPLRPGQMASMIGFDHDPIIKNARGIHFMRERRYAEYAANHRRSDGELGYEPNWV